MDRPTDERTKQVVESRARDLKFPVQTSYQSVICELDFSFLHRNTSKRALRWYVQALFFNALCSCRATIMVETIHNELPERILIPQFIVKSHRFYRLFHGIITLWNPIAFRVNKLWFPFSIMISLRGSIYCLSFFFYYFFFLLFFFFFFFCCKNENSH